MITATRFHDCSIGHRVWGHEGKCRHLHGHNYRVHFTCSAGILDTIGRVIDFSVIKEKLCMRLEDNWDHKMLLWDNDSVEISDDTDPGLVFVPFNPTAENMAIYLLDVVGPKQLEGTGVFLISVKVEETYKCSAEANNV